MKKISILTAFMFMACSGKHLGWVIDNKDNKNSQTEVIAPKLNQYLSGVQFTFDDGPDLAKTPKVLDILKKYNLQAIFFVEGINLYGESEQAQERRELLKRIMSEGHIVGNHTYDHKTLTSLSESVIMWEIDTTSKSIENIIGQKVTLIRLPYGKTNKKVGAILESRHLTPIYWSIDLREWERDRSTHRYKTKESLFAEFVKQFEKLKNEQGQKKIILLLHDTKSVTIEVLPLILDYLANTTQ